MKPLILAVENDPEQTGLLRGTLEAADFNVRTFLTANAMLSFASHCVPCLFLLDMKLPDMSGLDLCRQMRLSPRWSQAPVIFVSGRTSVADRVAGLELADDYICKPFGPRELVARVHAVLRRCKRRQPPVQLTAGDLHLDEVSRTVVVRGRRVRMTPREFELLAYLVRNVGRIFSRDELLHAVWNTRFVTSRSVDVYMLRLRKKVEPQPNNPCYLQTLRGGGYKLAPPIRCETVLQEAPNHLGLQAVPHYAQDVAA
jgi:two-component system, OmpR family, alkaline phosphatase synthesis response regulator PhoP